MIDTDKYEGHTRGPWYLVGQHCDDVGQELFWVHADDYICDITETNNHISEVWSSVKADAQLMADAPILLAEVKRLREVEREYNRLRENLVNITREYHESFGLISRLLEDVIAND